MYRVVLLFTFLAVLAVVDSFVAGPDSCPPGTRFCKLVGNDRCLHLEYRCDGVSDCDDNQDEMDCTECNPQHAFYCSGGWCVRNVERCDGRRECTDGSDESGCGLIPADKLFTCRDGTTRLKTVVCDGVFDCPGEEDEEGCTQEKCQPGTVWCMKDCWRPTYRCDGWKVCPDGEDEADCPDNLTYTTPATPTTTSRAMTFSPPTTTTLTTTPATTATPTTTTMTPIRPATPTGPRDLTALVYILSGTISLLLAVVAALACVLWRRGSVSRAWHPQEPEYAVVEYQAIHRRLGAGPAGATGAPDLPRRPAVPGVPGVWGAALEPLVDNPSYSTCVESSTNYDKLDFSIQ